MTAFAWRAPERLVVMEGVDVLNVLRALDGFGCDYTVMGHAQDPCDWVATWDGGHETHVIVP